MGAQTTGQITGLDAVARPAAAGGSVMSFMLAARSRAVPVDGTTAARVYGGRPAQPGAWPAQVALLAELPPDPGKVGAQSEGQADAPQGPGYGQFCGGSIIARQWILTAAHCVVGQDGTLADPAKLRIQTGATRLGAGDLRPVVQIIAHENYDPNLLDNDIALIKLAEPIGQTSGPVAATPVLRPVDPMPQGDAVVAGWGYMQDDKMPMDLMETDIGVLPNDTCNRGMAEQTKRDFGAFLMGYGQSNRIPMDKLEQAYDILVSNLGDSLTDNMICAGVASPSNSAVKAVSASARLSGRLAAMPIRGFSRSLMRAPAHDPGNSSAAGAHVRWQCFRGGTVPLRWAGSCGAGP
ncbi:MAG: hypothetical protein A2092_18785 [Rhodobacteraceae bacterium GWE1_64_9]|nr:MAG: hypothetical protein A2092_18785 [Rhodobacteraceae bacterium GWE1_64_9]